MDKSLSASTLHQQFPPSKFKLTLPASALGKPHEYLERTYILVQFDTDPESQDIYKLTRSDNSPSKFYALTKNGLKIISDALGIKWSTIRSDNRSNPELAEVVAKGKFLGLDGESEIFGIKANGFDRILKQIHSHLQSIIQCHKPTLAVIEKSESFTYSRSLSNGRHPLNQTAMQKNNIALGIISSVCIISGLEIRYLSPLEWKGFQSKEVTRTYVNERFKTKIIKSHHDESDAIKMGSQFIDIVLSEEYKRQEL